MLNPSTADNESDDPTITRCVDFARMWECGGITVGNLFAYVSTDAKTISKVTDPIGPENDTHLMRLHLHSKITVAAWGEMGKLRSRGTIVMQMLRRVKRPAFLAKTKSGEPQHPLYIKKNTMPRFD